MSVTSERYIARIESLSIKFQGATVMTAVQDVSLDIMPGEIVGIVGESGSGKSLTALSLGGLLPAKGCQVTARRLELLGHQVLEMNEQELGQMRGSEVAFVFQEPMSALNPTMRIGQLMTEVIRRHRGGSQAEAEAFAINQLESVSLPDCARVFRSYPFELSGGMRQRVLIALAFSMNPKLIVADEPTTALDMTVQADIMRLLRTKAEESGAAVLFISHDLPLVAQVCERLYVMQAGCVVESGDTRSILSAPATDYTTNLIACLPERNTPRQAINRTAKERSAELTVPASLHSDTSSMLDMTGVNLSFVTSRDWLGRPKTRIHALRNVNLTVQAGETFSVIGESGSGKTTLARAAVGLIQPDNGNIKRRVKIQMVFQDPKSSMSPRMPVWRIITEPARISKAITRDQAHSLAASLLEQVGISPHRMDAYLHQFSGGQRQRLAIARALSNEPDFLVLDEPTSALDVSVQAQILNLLLELQKSMGLTYLLISHDVGVVRHLSDRVAVMRQGSVVETGQARQVLEQPAHPYTKALLSAVPRLPRLADGR